MPTGDLIVSLACDCAFANLDRVSEFVQSPGFAGATAHIVVPVMGTAIEILQQVLAIIDGIRRDYMAAVPAALVRPRETQRSQSLHGNSGYWWQENTAAHARPVKTEHQTILLRRTTMAVLVPLALLGGFLLRRQAPTLSQVPSPLQPTASPTSSPPATKPLWPSVGAGIAAAVVAGVFANRLAPSSSSSVHTASPPSTSSTMSSHRIHVATIVAVIVTFF